MINFLNKQKLDNFFCGPVDVYPWYEVPEEDKITFVSGAGCFFSRDIIKKLIYHKDLYDFSLNDDVAISKLLVNKLKIPINFKTRSLNVAMSVAIVAAEALRQNNLLK